MSLSVQDAVLVVKAEATRRLSVRFFTFALERPVTRLCKCAADLPVTGVLVLLSSPVSIQYVGS